MNIDLQEAFHERGWRLVIHGSDGAYVWDAALDFMARLDISVVDRLDPAQVREAQTLRVLLGAMDSC